MKLLDESELQAFESKLDAALGRHLDAPGLRRFGQIIRGYVTAGGKRVRPQLAAWIYQAATDSRVLPPAVYDVAVGWELFHAFLLVHDDIIDGSDARRDQAALHRQLAEIDLADERDAVDLHVGEQLGIVAGDLLFSLAMSVWHELDVEAPTHRSLLRLFSRVACTTGFGQAIDILVAQRPIGLVDEATLLREYAWKTAAYTFEGPMLSGAILAGLGEAAQAAISRYALSLGQAYQLQNDLLDLVRPATEGCDIAQGKRTIALLQHRSGLDASARAAFDERLAAIAASTNGSKLADCDRLRDELLNNGAMSRGRAVIDALLADARAATRDAALPKPLGNALMALLDAIAAQYFMTMVSFDVAPA